MASWPHVGQFFPETKAVASVKVGSIPTSVVDVRAVVVVVVDIIRKAWGSGKRENREGNPREEQVV